MSRRGIAARRAQIALLALAALVALSASFAVSAAAGHRPAASAAKKKRRCKPGFKRVRYHRKSKCRQVPPVPLVRATLTWNTPVDLDLWAWDAGGAGGRAGGNPIPRTSFSAQAHGFGPENFTDLIHIDRIARPFSFGVCYQNDGAAAGQTPTQFTLVYLTPDKVSHALTGTLYGVGGGAAAAGGPAIPVSTAWCPS
jgi:hypothetical protein